MARDILFCNLKVLYKNQEQIVKEVVYKDVDGFYYNRKLFDTKVKVLFIEIIKIIGKENISNEYVEVKKSDEKRNNITGAYE